MNSSSKPVQKLNLKLNKVSYEWFVSPEFFEQTPTPDISKSVDDLIISHNILKYTHNPLGYAIKNMDTGYESYFLNGIPANKQEVERLKYNSEFADHLDKIITEEE